MLKGYSFVKRTCVLLSPLFLVTLASKELAFYAPVSTLAPILGGIDDINQIRKLEEEIYGSNPLPEGTKAYGDLLIQKVGYSDEIWIEQINPLAGLKYGQAFKYEELKIGGKEVEKLNVIKKDDNSYQIQKTSFESSKLNEKGGLNLLTVFDLNLHNSDSTIPITHVAPLSDLINVPQKHYSVVKVENKSDLWGNHGSQEHLIILKKDDSHNSFSIELSNKFSPIRPSSNHIGENLSSLVIKGFYILYNDEPPLDPQRYFSSTDGDLNIEGDTNTNPRAKKVLLSRWKNNAENAENAEEPKYKFSTSNGFWKSECKDPYRVGGFIDKELKGKPDKKEPEKLTKKESEDAQKVLEKQKKSYVDFKLNSNNKQPHKSQYYWKDITNEDEWVPSDDNDEDWKQPCDEEPIDSETKSKLEYYLKSDKFLDREEKTNKQIDNSIIPDALKLKLQQTKGEPENKYPYHKIVQSSFRAWGNVYNTKDLKGPQIKVAGKYNSDFERAVKTEHKFEITIEKDVWQKELISKDKLNELKSNNDVSSSIEVHYPLSFTFYDPISNYLKKHRLLLKTELNLRDLYLQSSHSREVFSFDIGNENRVIGKDYQGFDPEAFPEKAKEYGLDGTLSLIAGLEIGLDKKLKISLTAQTNGFVNTKNPSCDLRHRLYKINGSNGDSNLKEDLKCSKEQGWKYRDYNHIPSFLVISLTGAPEVASFYIDNKSGDVSENSEIVQKDSQGPKIKNLSGFEKELETKEIIKVFERDETNNGHVYFKDIASYRPRDDEFGYDLQLKGWLWTNYQYIYYFIPRKQENYIELTDVNNLKSLKLHLGGSQHANSDFFYSGHFNTIKTLCINNKYPQAQAQAQAQKSCADGIKYETLEEDKEHSDLTAYAGAQIVDIDWSNIKSQSQKPNRDEPFVVNFRTVLNRAEGDNKFKNNTTKLEELFKEQAVMKSTDSAKAPNFSLLAVWYTVELWCESNKLYYVTKVRPISMVSQEIDNASAHKASGAAGSAGFLINKFEFNYSSTVSSPKP